MRHPQLMSASRLHPALSASGHPTDATVKEYRDS
jgi:hypothetical protein